MRRLAGLSIAALLLVAAHAWSQAFTLADYSGEELFERFCASCHGESGRGDGPVARHLKVAPADLTAISRRNGGEFPAGRIRETIDGRLLIDSHGRREMPVWGYEFWVESGATAEAERDMHALIEKLVEHVRTLQREPAEGERRRR